jgi:hypothetical protein
MNRFWHLSVSGLALAAPNLSCAQSPPRAPTPAAISVDSPVGSVVHPKNFKVEMVRGGAFGHFQTPLSDLEKGQKSEPFYVFMLFKEGARDCVVKNELEVVPNGRLAGPASDRYLPSLIAVPLVPDRIYKPARPETIKALPTLGCVAIPSGTGSST